MPWAIEWDERAADDLADLDAGARNRIHRYLVTRIVPAENPRALGRALRGPLGDLWRYRVGNYRLLCRIEDARLVVLVVAVGHRREVYR